MRKLKKFENKQVVGGVNTGGLGDDIVKRPVTTNRMLRWPRRPWDADPMG